MAYNEKRKQALECQRWNHAEIDRRDGGRMVAQECPPSLPDLLQLMRGRVT